MRFLGSITLLAALVACSSNSPPEFIDAPSSLEGAEGKGLTFALQAQDSDGDQLTYSVDSPPPNLTLNAQSGRVNWTPSFSQAGTYKVTFYVSDSEERASTTITIAIANTNRTPNFFEDVPSKVEGSEGTLLTFTASAEDLDEDTITYGIATPPAGLAIDSASGEVTWTPDFDQAGEYRVEIYADDGADRVSLTVDITISNTNRSPVFLGEVPTRLEVAEGSLLLFTAQAEDPDGDTLTYGIENPPRGLVIDGTSGAVTWTPDFSQSGEYPVEVFADDSSTRSSFTINITVLNALQWETVLEDITVPQFSPLNLVARASTTNDQLIVEYGMDIVTGCESWWRSPTINTVTGTISGFPMDIENCRLAVQATAYEGSRVDGESIPGLVIEDLSTVTDTLEIVAEGIISGNITIPIEVTHTYIGDLIITLTSPSGTSVLLYEGFLPGSEIVGVYPTTLTPAEDLRVFIGEPIGGTWTLEITDRFAFDSGTLVRWGVSDENLIPKDSISQTVDIHSVDDSVVGWTGDNFFGSDEWDLVEPSVE